jgi:hypothetical protein
MTVSYLDPINAEVIYDSRRTIVLAFSDKEKRQFAIEFFNQYHADVLDIYRDPETLIPKIFDYCCMMRIVDHETYLRIENDVAEYVEDDYPEGLTPLVVYGAKSNQIIDNIAVINGTTTHPKMLAAFFSALLKSS